MSQSDRFTVWADMASGRERNLTTFDLPAWGAEHVQSAEVGETLIIVADPGGSRRGSLPDSRFPGDRDADEAVPGCGRTRLRARLGYHGCHALTHQTVVGQRADTT
jgi:hypothetical protein